MIRSLILIIGLVSTNVYADTYIDINGFSKHSLDHYVYNGKKTKFNSNNFGLGITTSLNKYLDFKYGGYYNSYYKTSLYTGLNIKMDISVGPFIVAPGLFGGVATGYDNTPVGAGMVQPFVIPNFTVRYKDVGVTIGYIPATPVKDGYEEVSAWTLQFNYRTQ